MHTEFLRRATRIAAIAAGSLILPHLALAQSIVNGLPIGAGAMIKPRQHQNNNQAAPPPALPGAASQGNAAPATESASAMSPNHALFDAINRGDIAGVRDALNRGAILSARNDLGLTPIELALDLGHRDILFLLLSVRGADSGSGAPPSAASSVQQAAAKPGPLPVHPKPAARVAARSVAPASPAPAPQQPTLFANDGGSPIPSIGFLGFGTARGSP